MDAITTAILAAITAGAISGVNKASEQIITDAYTKLKDLLKKKFGAKSEVIKAVKSLELKPESASRRNVLQEKVVTAKADQDPELLRAAKVLIEIIISLPYMNKSL